MKTNQATNIDSWRTFRDVTGPGAGPLLPRLPAFAAAVLVSGCQRSGTTVMAQLLAASRGMADYFSGGDSELEGALILAGLRPQETHGRYCFQTTYVDQRYPEYFQDGADFSLIWMVRNPFSTVYSLTCNWPRWALDYTFHAGAWRLLQPWDRLRLRLFGGAHVDALQRGCLIYNWKLSHLPEIGARLGPERILVVDYDDLVLNKERRLPGIYRFLELPYDPEYAGRLRSGSINKKNALSAAEQARIDHLCDASYTAARRWARDHGVLLEDVTE